MIYVKQNAELYHHGVKGMKWGVRRYQNKDGTLTAAGRKRVSKQYKSLSKKTTKAIAKDKTLSDKNITAKALSCMNDEGSLSFIYLYAREYDKALLAAYKNNPSYREAQTLVKKYNMTSWDKLAKENSEVIKELEYEVTKAERLKRKQKESAVDEEELWAELANDDPEAYKEIMG